MNLQQDLLRKFLGIGFAQNLLAGLALIIIPGDPKSAWVLGFSKSRLILIGVILLICLINVVLFYLA